MSKTKTGLEDLDITNEELGRLTKAFKNEEFKKLFAEYYEEVNDPANRRIFEAELTQLEAERGVDITFVHPEPGYVLKTVSDGRLKTFINVAKCDKIGQPSSSCGRNSCGDKGLNWSLPYAQSAVRRDYDKKGEACAVYDVVFHPDTIHLALKNDAFKQLVTSTAVEAVAAANGLVLDVVNLKLPKISFKGIARPTVIRKKSKTQPKPTDDGYSSPIDAIYPPLRSEIKSNKVAKDARKDAAQQAVVSKYTTPKYSVCQRKNVEYAELTNELDAKLNVTIPSELVVTVELPLLRNIKDTTLDVTAEELYLISEVPAKYQVRVKLPYPVDEVRGSAKFDSDKRSLVVTLPVRRRQMTIDDITNGNATDPEYIPKIEEV